MTNNEFSKIEFISGQKHDAKQFKAECVNHILLHRVQMNKNILDNAKAFRNNLMNVMFMMTQKTITEPLNQSS